MSFSPTALSAASSLYCPEYAEDVASWGHDAVDDEPTEDWEVPTFFPIAGERPFSVLLAAEEDHMPRQDYVSRILSGSIDATARLHAINWISKAFSFSQEVSEFYCFRPVTTYLAVNYLDRFLSGKSLPVMLEGKSRKIQSAGGWPMQLLSVACVSVAAKMEETRVPLLLDLQILDPKYLFEPKTIRRMELLLMASLRWRMRAITPFDFLSHFSAAVLSVDDNSSPVSGSTLFFRAVQLIIRTHRVIGFLGFRPSTIAAAAVLCSAGDIGAHPLSVYGWTGEGMLRDCRQLMEESLTYEFPSARRYKALRPAVETPPPLSPAGVLDASACGSSDSQKSSANEAAGSKGAGDFPLACKRRRISGALCTESIDIERG
ncbi:Cyclin-D4-1 [Apostasia shenzhenica]|uniref:Cyclin-D4-1 n=1 Tax=Apostasia shenzhenica TaxID=1088818 RepID=A0A2I0AWI1_9ASPA|nr:Cyclin-D4-1 [Apostasia shenzhenica]